MRNPGDPPLPPYTASSSSRSAFDFSGKALLSGGTQSPMLGRAESLTRMQQEYNNVAPAPDQNTPLTPFSPFAPFSPVNPINPTTQAASLTGYTPAVRSSLYQTETLAPPSPAKYLDPETATAMGIHSSVINEAESGVSEADIERRRARAQRRLERQQRAEEGSIVEDQRAGFRQWAKNNDA